MEEIQKNKTSLVDLIVVVILIGTIMSLLFSLYYNRRLETQVKERDALIDSLMHKDLLIHSLMKKDSLLNMVFDLKYDSTGTTYSYTYRTQNGRILKYNELAAMKDSLENSHYVEIDTRIEKYNLLVENYNLLLNKQKKLVGDYNRLVELHNIQQKQLTNMQSDLFSKEDSLSLYKSVVELVEKNYPIRYKVQDIGAERTISIISKQIDSALILLPYYRECLKYNSQKKAWEITIKPRVKIF